LFDGKPRQLDRILYAGLADFDNCPSDYSCHGVIAVAQLKGLKAQLIGFG
jgi:hypothetical protein